MISDGVVTLIGRCCGNGAIRRAKFYFLKEPFPLNSGVQFLSLLQGLFLQEKSGRGLHSEKVQIS